MTSDIETSYNDAVQKLVVELVSEPNVTRVPHNRKRVLIQSYLDRLGLNDRPPMKIIHVSGTKGKGSTCAFCESIMHSHGYTTGMFSSPHMNEARERVRLNKKPATKEVFATNFWEVYNKLKETATTDELNVVGGMPACFNFTLLMAMYVFHKLKVDVAIFEVGIGGEYDSTNFLFSQPTVCGVTSLGYDHVKILGHTLGEIAWHKAGIMKTGCPAITVLQELKPPPVDFERKFQPSTAVSLQGRVIGMLGSLANFLFWPMTSFSSWFSRFLWRDGINTAVGKHPLDVIRSRAAMKKCPIFIAPPLQGVELGISGLKQPVNAALAVQICKLVRNHEQIPNLTMAQKSWTINDIPRLVTTENDLDIATLEGLRTCYWPARTEIVRHNDITYYIDGAHNPESIEHCASWFKHEADKEKAEIESQSGSVVRLLVFNLTKNRNPGTILTPLVSCSFDEAVFTPNLLSTAKSGNVVDHYDKWLTSDIKEQVPTENRATWDMLTARSKPSLIFPCALQAMAWVTQGRDPMVKVRDPVAKLPQIPSRYRAASHIQVLVTGSLLLVGPVLGVLKPWMND